MNQDSIDYNKKVRSDIKQAMDAQKQRLLSRQGEPPSRGEKKKIMKREAKTTYAVTPFKNQVLFELVANKSFYVEKESSIIGVDSIKTPPPQIFEVKAYGEETEGVEIGDYVLLKSQPALMFLNEEINKKTTEGVTYYCLEAQVLGFVDKSKLVDVKPKDLSK